MRGEPKRDNNTQGSKTSRVRTNKSLGKKINSVPRRRLAQLTRTAINVGRHRTVVSARTDIGIKRNNPREGVRGATIASKKGIPKNPGKDIASHAQMQRASQGTNSTRSKRVKNPSKG